MGEIIFITGTDTGVGKTVLTAFLLHHLRSKKIRALAMKPFCTGDRGDVEILQNIQRGELSDSEVNPYFFPEPIAPFIAAKIHRKNINLHHVVEKVLEIKKRCDILLVEGADGVMVPIGKNFLMRDLIVELRCRVIVVARNQLGTINHTLLTVNALQDSSPKELTIVSMDAGKPDFSSRTNRNVLKQFLVLTSIVSIPFLGKKPTQQVALKKTAKKLKKNLL